MLRASRRLGTSLLMEDVLALELAFVGQAETNAILSIPSYPHTI